MNEQHRFAIACVVVFAAFGSALAAESRIQSGSAKGMMSAAAQASPELVTALSKEMGSTPEQAAGAAGALFGVAKSRLKAEEFSLVSNSVPGMTSLLGAAPPAKSAGLGNMTQVAGAAGGLASAASAFSALGLKPEMVAKAVPVLTSFVTKSGGANVGQLLATVLK